ncbi:hypothetical protein L7F22_019556 [Adiantum nelumboides]|nr:hypothetical protein [Adiantum nelumboides]
MPPPHFQSTAPSGSNAGSSSQANITSQISDLPKLHKQLVRDALQFIRQSLVTNDAIPSPTNKTTTAAYDAIRKLVSDPILQANEESTTSQTSSGSRSRGAGSSTAVSTESTNTALLEAKQLRKQVSSIMTNTLSRIFSDEMDQDSKPLTQLLVSYIHALHGILDPKCIVLEWWDVLIRPVLKDPHCNPSIARKAHQLVVWVMRSTPSSNYIDEPAPRAVWPAAPQSAIAAEHTRLPRQPGAAPYPISSTRAPSTSRSSEDGDARRNALFSTKINYGKASADPLRRFTERIFDLYTTEASSTGMRDIEDDDIREVGIDQPSPSEESPIDGLDHQLSERKSVNARELATQSMELDVVSTWKGNLEAIILTFGEEKPKAFFHHLSESFLEPSARIPILLLLTIFFRISSLHAYHVVSTPFVRFLLMSLQLDTSKTAAALGAFALSTLIPHIPNWIANGGAGGLPALLSILARIVDWRKLGPKWEDRENALLDNEGKEMEEWAQVQRISRRLNVRSDIQWKRLGTDSDNIAPAAPDAERLFTFLYGIFPCNVIRFLRAPVDYLRKAEYETPFEADWDDIIDEIAVQNSSAPILRRHVLHPSLVDMDAESEITDKQRWREHDAADITAECVCLYIGGQLEEQEFWHQSRKPSIIDHIPSLLKYRSSSGSAASSIGGLTHQRIPSGLVQAVNAVALSEAYDGSQTPVRFYRKRSVSENLGRRGSVESPLVQQHASGRKRDLSAQPGQHAGTAMFTSPKMLPFSPQSSLHANEADIFLQNHIRLRYGHGTDRTPTGSAGESLSRSSSLHSHLKTFNIARTNLSSTLMSPTASQQPVAPDSTTAKDSKVTSPPEDTSVGASSPANQSRRSTISLSKDAKGENTSPNVFNTVASPSIANRMMMPSTNDLLGSPALGMDISKQTRSVLKEEVKQTIAYLKQENLQLRNELNYEIGQKDQMIRHIGRIHRDRIKDTVMEEERQNLYATLRSLRAQLRNIRSTQELSKAETIASKNRHASWENELNAKLKAFREEKKVWANEVRQLQIVKEDYEALIQKLEGQLHDNANEVFELREQCKRDAKKVAAIRQYEEKMQKMEECLRMWDDDMIKFDTQRRQIEEMSNRYEELAMLLDATEADRRRAENDELMAKRQAEIVEKELRATQALLERQTKAEHSIVREAEGEKVNDGIDAKQMVTKGSRGRTQEDEEKERLKERVQRLEEELLEVKAQKEEWQMEQLWKRLKGEQEEQEKNVIPLSYPHADHDVAPFELGQNQEETV